MGKKIGAIVSLSIIAILIIATIIMANINVNYKINCATPTSVWVGYNSNEAVRKVENPNAIVDYINNASKDKVLTALFNGTLGKKAEVVAESNTGKNIPSTNGFYVRFYYEDAQKLMEGKKEYKNSKNEVVYYHHLVFTVSNLEGTNEVTVYVVPSKTDSKSYTHYYKLEADFEDLYDYLVENNYSFEN